jgi:RHS repeat-associated protein
VSRETKAFTGTDLRTRRPSYLLRAVRLLAVGATIAAGLVALPIGSTPDASALTTTTFSYTGSSQTWTVPSGVTSIQVDARGAQGGGTYGGLGARIVATVPVTPGQVLYVMVGGSPTPNSYSVGYNGGGSSTGTYGSYGPSGGGGGASDVRTSTAVTSRIVVAGGGGGSGVAATPTYGAGGSGGTSTGQSGDTDADGDTPGTGGSQTVGGTGVSFGGSSGSLGSGANSSRSGGGGGGGYYGGGSGADSALKGAGGGGGSDYLESSGSGETDWAGFNSDNGEVLISYGSGGGSGSGSSGSVSFSYTGAPQYWTVPTGVTSIEVDARGAQGGGGFGGPGVRLLGTVPVTPGQVLEITVGGSPTPNSYSGGYDGGGTSTGTYDSDGPPGGGGGASDIRAAGITLEDRILVAAGGGGSGVGASSVRGAGGSGGTSTGQSGDTDYDSDNPGAGGSQSAGGAGGSGGFGGGTGSLGNGGNSTRSGGGGGGGYYGGGAGGDSALQGAGGAGGSDYLESSGSGEEEWSGYNPGNGSVTIGYPTLSTPAPQAPTVTSFTYTGATQSWTVPTGITSIEVDVRGAQGGNGGGYGARVITTLPVTPGQVLEVIVGGSPTPHSYSLGYNGGGSSGGTYGSPGGGGGASDIRASGTTLENRIVVAGGGGGTGLGGVGSGGVGGTSTGQSGSADAQGDTPGTGGSQTAGGVGVSYGGSSGRFGSGGNSSRSGGGGGGGYYGGGSGADSALHGAGGGGGSDYIESSASGTTQWSGYNSGNGSVFIGAGSFNATGGNLLLAEELATNPSENFCAACHGDPINTETGGLTESFTDLSIPGPGPALSFGRSYNSALAAFEGPLGYGWTDSYNMSLTFGSGSPPSTVTVNQEDGNSVTFTYSGSAYAAPPRVMATLTDSGGTWTFARQATSIFTFNSSGQLTSESDLNGYATTLSYSSGKLSTITDPEGRTLSLSYGTNGLISEVADSSSPARTVSYGYDSSGDLTDVIDVDGGHTQFTYNSSHQLLTWRTPRYYGNTTTSPTPVTTNVYNGAGQVTSQTDPMGRTTTFSYTTFSTTITDPNGDVILEQYRNGVLIARTTGYGTAEAATTQYSYDPNTLGLIQTINPDGSMTSATFDSSGNMLTSVDALGNTTTYTYNSLDEPTSVETPDGVTTTNTYDSDGNLTSVSTPLVGSSPAVSATTTYAYGSTSHPSLVTEMTNPDGNSWTYGYDSDGDLTSSTDPLGNETTSTFNSIGQKLTQVSPRGNVSGATPADFTTTYTYNNASQVLTVTNPLGHVTTYTYDSDGNKSSEEDGRGNTTSYTYDADEELTGVTNPDSTTESYTYDGNGNKLTYTDENGHTTTYTYSDPAYPAAVTSSEDADSRTTDYTYNSVGEKATMVDPSSRTTTYAYDADGHLTGITYSDGVTPDVTYTYDVDGQRTDMTDGTGTTTYSYDSLSRLTSTTDGAGNTVGYVYDLAGNQTSITYPGSVGSVTYSYNAANQMTSVEDWNGNTTTYTPDPDGNVTSEALPNGDTSSTTYDDADQLSSISDAPTSSPGSPFATFSYTRDGDGQVTAETDTGVPSPTSQSYTYDTLNRLTSATTAAYSYDSAGNLTTNSAGASQSFDSANQLTSATAGSITTTYTYNSEGQRTATSPSSGPGAATYSYDQAGDLIGYTGTVSATYSYNGDGLRMSKTVGGTTTDQVWDTSGSIPQVLADGSTYYIYGAGGLPLEQINGSNTYYFLHDQLGSTRVLTDSSGNVAATFTYDPYGALIGSTGSVTTPLGFAGAYTDAESGLIYLVDRYYDPTTAQFISIDPMVAETQSPYGYVGGDPVNGIDPSGLCKGIWGCIDSGIHTVARVAAPVVNRALGQIADTAGAVQLAADAAAVVTLFIPGVDVVAPEILAGVSEISGIVALGATCLQGGSSGDSASLNSCQASLNIELSSGGFVSGSGLEDLDKVGALVNDLWGSFVNRHANNAAMLTAEHFNQRACGS